MSINYEPSHQPIMVSEIIDHLIIKDNGLYLDATIGEGGHSEALLNNNSAISLICNDRDKVILSKAQERLKPYKNRIQFTNLNFYQLDKYLKPRSIDGIIADLGISSYHFDRDDRGFSFNRDEILDMRLDKGTLESAYDIINNYDEKDLANIIYKYGEERYSRKIAKNIIIYRQKKVIKTTYELSKIIAESIPRKYHPKNINPATKTFQSLRIFINDELNSLDKGIDTFVRLLKHQGRLCILTFHSLEDKIVKRKFRNLSGYRGNRNPFLDNDNEEPLLSIITKKPIKPTEKEILNNPRSRSAKLRIAEKI